MADPDDRLRRLYGTLPREEPPPALDAAVLAAARRAVARPSLVRRWGAPVSIAAVLVLVVGVTLEMQRERPGVETSVAPSSAPPAAAPEAPPATKPSAEAPKAQRAMKAKAAPARTRPEPAPEAKRGAPPAADSLEAAPAARAPAPPAPAAASANLSVEKRAGAAEPAVELERIAKLRAEGKDADADRALEDFRARHPGYRIDDAMWARVRPR